MPPLPFTDTAVPADTRRLRWWSITDDTGVRPFIDPGNAIAKVGRMETMEIATQLALFLENRPGMLADVCTVLSKAKINIYAITTSDTVDHAVIRLVVSDTARALALFEERGTLVVASEVLMIEGDNRPGSLVRIGDLLGKARINIEYAYCATSPNARKGLLILRVNNARKALKILNSD